MTIGAKPAILAAETEVETHSGYGILRRSESGAIRVTVTNRGGATAQAVVGAVHPPAGPAALQITSPFALGDIEPGETKTEEVPLRALESGSTEDLMLALELHGSAGVKLGLDPVSVKIRPPSLVDDHTGPAIEILDQLAKESRSIRPLQAAERHINTSRPSFVLRGIVRDSSGVVKVTVGGAETRLRWTPAGMAFEREVALKQGDNTVDVIAVDKFGNQTRLGLRITRDDSLIEGRYFALLIAVQDYEDPAIPPLAKPIEDAERLAAVLKENYTFEPANVTILRNPDREGILREMMVLRNKLGERDNLLMFYAGHGNEDAQAKMGYWLPSNAGHTEKSKWLSNSDVGAELRAMKVRHAFLITDACFSGALLKSRGTPQEFTAQKLYELPSRRGMTSGNETVPEPSVFLEQVIQQLKNNKDRYLLAQDLYARLRNTVVYNSPMKQIPNYGVIPLAGDQDGDFVFVRR